MPNLLETNRIEVVGCVCFIQCAP